MAFSISLCKFCKCVGLTPLFLIRKQLNLKPGSQFVVVGDKDVVILKNISPPSIKDFDGLIAEARRQGKKAGLKKSDIQDAILDARGKKK